MPELLLELFSEEIPARMQKRAREDLKKLILEGLKGAGLGHGETRVYSTPRRLTLVIDGLAAETEAVSEELKGPRVDAPEKALEGFLRKTGLTKDQLEARDDKKGKVWFAVTAKPARAAADVLAELVPAVVRSFPWPKSMRWGSGDLRWVRPLRSILCQITDGGGARIAAFDIDGIESSDVTYGHRVLGEKDARGRPAPIKVAGFADYVAKLAAAGVTLDQEARKSAIETGIAALAKKAKLEVVPDPRLLDEVTGLVEHPAPLVGTIDEAFLQLPPEVLQTSMREHQKFFSLRDATSGLITRFATVANVSAADGGKKIIAGNERVLRARLADAQFFYANDLAKPLGENIAKLEAVTFHNQLGSQAARVTRIRALAQEVASLTGAQPVDADRAAELAKADLVSEMVYEFPELQGLMGRYYATAAGEKAEIATAIETHYAPLGPSDDVPTGSVAAAVALADKLDSLAGFWAIGEKPTGSGDPYALRRAALGVIRIILENRLRLSLDDLLEGHTARIDADAAAAAEDAGKAPTFDDGARADLHAFIFERLKVFLRDRGHRRDVIDAAMSRPRGAGAAPDDITLINQRVEALGVLMGSEDGANLLAAYKRANNILTAEEAKDGVEYGLDPDPKYADAAEEKALFKALDAAEAAIEKAVAK